MTHGKPIATDIAIMLMVSKLGHELILALIVLMWTKAIFAPVVATF